jgi:Ser/Thr protein kinase RdoA (MazF antagonist)
MGIVTPTKRAFEAAGAFQLDGKILRVEPLGSGHIHDTYLVEANGNASYVLQRMNENVFRDIPGLMRNLETVLSYLSMVRPDQPLLLIGTNGGMSYLTDAFDDKWRMFRFIPGSLTCDRVESQEIAVSGGAAFGAFVAALRDLPPEELVETIPAFHDLERRLDAFNIAIKNEPVGRTSGVTKEISAVESLAEEMLAIHRLGRDGALPLRVVHNDTKINNVLFDSDSKAICVIDLDTVMPGYIHYDFGDMLRTGASTAGEDEPDSSSVAVDMRLLEGFAAGFIRETQTLLTQTEADTLALAPAMMTYMIGVRFLTDYLAGDPYFKTSYEEQNLVRARNQLRLAHCYRAQQDAIESVLSRLLNLGDG